MELPIRINIIRSLLKKEFKQILRDRRTMIVLFLQPLIMLFIMGYAVNMDVKKIKIAILDEDKTHESREFLQKFISSEYFVFYDYLNSSKQMNEYMDKGEIDVFMHIPANFSKDIKSGKKTDIQLILDGTNSNTASIINAYIEQITNDFSFKYFKDRIRALVLNRDTGGMKLTEVIDIQERVLFNPELKSRNFYLPGLVGLLITLIGIMLTSMTVVKEKEAGTIEQIIVSPLKSSEYILGKILPFIIIAFIHICLVTFGAIFWFNVPFRGSFVFLLFSGFVYLLATLPIGLFISTVSRTQQEAMLSSFLYFMPAMLFSGFVFPIYVMPVSIQILTYFIPMRYFIKIIRGVFLKGIGFSVLWPEILILMVFAVVLFTLSVRRFARRME
jgi:ABC-2 type transport system permease protein